MSIYSLFYLLYILYPNHLRRELQPESAQTMTSTDRPISRLGIDKVLLVSPRRSVTPSFDIELPVLQPLFSHFKLQPNVVFGSLESEKQEARWQNESWQQLIGNGDRVRDFHAAVSCRAERHRSSTWYQTTCLRCYPTISKSVETKK